jgi:RHS repeat-associated protein
MHIVSYTNYYPFGMAQPGRNWSSGGYRFGYNGVEKDDEIKGSGNSYNFEFRMHDPRVGRFLSMDPFAGNSPVRSIDFWGLEEAVFVRGTSQSYNDALCPEFQEVIKGIYYQLYPDYKDKSIDFTFSWDDENYIWNNEQDRSQAAINLANHVLKNHEKGEPIVLLGYSHGFNVSLQAVPLIRKALSDLGEKDTEINLVAFSVPAYNQEGDVENPRTIQHLFNRLDYYYTTGVPDKTIKLAKDFSLFSQPRNFYYEVRNNIGIPLETNKIHGHMVKLNGKKVEYKFKCAHSWLFDSEKAAEVLDLEIRDRESLWNEFNKKQNNSNE